MPELSKVIVTPMRPEEAEAVSALVAEIISALPYYNERARREEVAKYTPERLRSLVAEEPEAVLLARANHDVCGFAISHYDDGLIWIAWFGVRPDWRRRGIGTQLLAAVEETAPRRRAHKIWCDTRTENLISQQLLQKAGYKKNRHSHKSLVRTRFLSLGKTSAITPHFQLPPAKTFYA